MSTPTDADVRAIVDLPASLSTTTFIATAVLLVNEELAGANLSQGRLDQIQLYLAAHFATITSERGGLTSQKVGPSEDKYAPSSRDLPTAGIGSTRYGQQAVSLDSSGRLASLGAGARKARVKLIPGGAGNWRSSVGHYV